VAAAGDVAAGSGAEEVIDADALAAQTQGAAKPKSAYAGGHVSAAASRSGSKATEPKAAVPKAEPKAAEPKVASAALPSLPPAPDPKAKADPPAPAASGAKFNREAALAVLGMAASRAASCKKPDGPTGSGKVYVTFDPSGSVVIANVVGAPIAGTGVAQCVANLFRKVKVPPFGGDRASLSKDFTIPQ